MAGRVPASEAAVEPTQESGQAKVQEEAAAKT